MASGVGQREEFVLISDTLAYITERTGIEFEPRQFMRYVESGVLMVNDDAIELLMLKVGERWFVARPSVEVIILAIRAASRT